MADQAKLELALQRAHEAGDRENAHKLATALKMLREGEVIPQEERYQDVVSSDGEIPEPNPAYREKIYRDDQRITDPGKFAISSIGRGVKGLAKLPADFMQLVNKVDTKALPPSSFPPIAAFKLLPKIPDSVLDHISETQDRGMDSILPYSDRKPANSFERVADVAVQGAIMPELALGKWGPKIRDALVGMTAAGTGGAVLEGMSNVEGPGKHVASVAAALGAGGGLGYITRHTPNVETILNTAVPDQTTADVLRTAAGKAVETRKSTGAPMHTGQYLEGPKSPYTDLEEALLMVGGGDQLAKNLRAQGPAIQNFANTVVESLPGKPLPTQSSANAVQDAATQKLLAERKAASKQYGKTFETEQAAEKDALRGELIQAENEIVEQSLRADPKLRTAEKIESMTAADRKAAAVEALAAQTTVNRENLVKAAGESQQIPRFASTELGPDIARFNAQRTQRGLPQKDSWTAGELEEAGYLRSEIDTLLKDKQPITSGTGVVQINQKAEPGEVHSFVPKAEKAAADIRLSVDEQLAKAEESYNSALDAVKSKDQLPLQEIEKLKYEINRQIKSQTGNASAQKDLNFLKNALGGLKTTEHLHTFVKSVNDNLPSMKVLNNANKRIAKNSVAGHILGKMKATRDRLTPAYAIAGKEYESAKEGIRKLQKETDLQAIATVGGSAEDRLASKHAFARLMDEGESPKLDATDQRLGRTLSAIGEQEPEALANAFRTYLDDKLAQVFGPKDVARPPELPGKALTSILGDASNPKNDYKLQGIKVAVDTIVKTSKLSKQDALALRRGVDQLTDLANANSRSPANITSLTPSELKDFAKDPGKLAMLRTVGISLGLNILRTLEPYMLKSTYKKLDDLVSDPSRIEDLIKLGQQPKFSRKDRERISALIGAVAAQNIEKEGE